jgi:hypothetical protein
VVEEWARAVFSNVSRDMMAVPVSTGTAFQAATPVKLFTAPHLLRSERHHAYDISLNDQQFIMVRNSQKYAHTLGVVVNWGSEIKRLTRKQ